MSSEHTDRNLLFGVLALQADLITNTQFVDACSAWAGRKDAALPDILLERRWITDGDRADVERLLERKLKKHRGDVRASLVELVGCNLRAPLAALPNGDLRQSVADLTPPPPPDGLATVVDGRQLGHERYLRTRLHAMGGLGRVWLAHDQTLNRDVALKEIRPEQVRNPVLQARFVREATITGQLEHPGIVPIYELVIPSRSTGDGPASTEHAPGPFYTMRFIRGRTMADAIHDYHDRRSQGKAGALDFTALLNAFIGVCNAVAYAHAQGVVHRDLKPQNVVLGDFGEVIVLDWGLAKVAGGPESIAADLNEDHATPVFDPERLTGQGQKLGTPAYMAPEQAEGTPDLIDVRTDVYGLGAILYELLTGRPPFTGSDTPEVLRQVCVEVPPRPRLLVPSTPPALEAVCLKALSKHREGRYSSARKLAGDVQRWLADEPVSAYPEPWTTKTRRWMRRHRLVVTGSVAALTVAALILTLTTLLLGAKNRELVEAKARADANFEIAKEAVNKYFTEVSADPDLKRADFSHLRKRLLETALPFQQKLVELKSDDPKLEAERGLAYHRLGLVRSAIGETEAARRDYEQMQAIFSRLVAADPNNPEHTHDLAISHGNLGSLYSDLGLLDKAEAAHRQAMAINEGLVERHPSKADYRHSLGLNYHSLGHVLGRTGRNGEAEVAYVKALKLRTKLTEEFPKALGFRSELASSSQSLGILRNRLGKGSDAEAGHRQAVATWAELMARAPNDPEHRDDFVRGCNNLALLLSDRGSTAEAEEWYCDALWVIEDLAANYRTIPAYREHHAWTLTNLGVLWAQSGKPGPAEAAFAQSLALRRGLGKEFPAMLEYQQKWAQSAHNWGTFLNRQRRQLEAEEAYGEALAIRKRLVKEYPSVPSHRQELADSFNNLGNVLADLKRFEQAEAALAEAVRLYDQLATEFPAVPAHRARLASTLTNRGMVLGDLDRHAEAEAAYRQAIRSLGQLVDAFPGIPDYRQSLAKSYYSLAGTLNDKKRSAEAEAAYRQALNRYELLVAEFPTDTDYALELGYCYLKLAKLLRSQHQLKPALDYCGKAIEVMAPHVARDRRIRAGPHNLKLAYERAEILDELSRPAEAAESWTRALELAPASDHKRLKWFRALSQARAGDHISAVATANELAQLKDLDARSYYDLASVWALAAASDEADLRERYAARTMELLSESVKKGYKDAAQFKKDKNLDALRGRAEFQRLLEELGGK